MHCKLWPEGFTTLEKGGGAPAVNHKMERLQMALLKKQLKESTVKFPEMPVMKEPPPSPPPPVAGGSSDQFEAQQEAQRAARRRFGYAATLMSGR